MVRSSLMVRQKSWFGCTPLFKMSKFTYEARFDLSLFTFFEFSRQNKRLFWAHDTWQFENCSWWHVHIFSVFFWDNSPLFPVENKTTYLRKCSWSWLMKNLEHFFNTWPKFQTFATKIKQMQRVVRVIIQMYHPNIKERLYVCLSADRFWWNVVSVIKYL